MTGYEHQCLKEREFGIMETKLEQIASNQQKLLDATFGKNGDPGIIDDIRVIRRRNKNLYDALFKPFLSTVMGGFIMWILMRLGMGH